LPTGTGVAGRLTTATPGNIVGTTDLNIITYAPGFSSNDAAQRAEERGD
jgi:hypothetical protein